MFLLYQFSSKSRKYTVKDGQVIIPVNCHKFYGDITIMVFHAKSLLGTEKVNICFYLFKSYHIYITNHLNTHNSIKYRLPPVKYVSYNFILHSYHSN